jgi:hypothetical protein
MRLRLIFEKREPRRDWSKAQPAIERDRQAYLDQDLRRWLDAQGKAFRPGGRGWSDRDAAP